MSDTPWDFPYFKEPSQAPEPPPEPEPENAFLLDTMTGGPESLGIHVGEIGASWADLSGPSDPTTVADGAVGLIVDNAERYAVWLASGAAPSEDYTMRVVVRRTPPDDFTNAEVELVIAMRYGGGDWLLLSVQLSDPIGLGQQARITLKAASAYDISVDDVPFADNEEHEFVVVLTGNLATLYLDGVALRSNMDISGLTGGLQTYLLWSGHAPAASEGVPMLAVVELECTP